MYQKRTNKETKESAVSPVVGVMLMLVVTIIIAAVVAVFASGIVTTQKVAPVGSFDTKLTTSSITIDTTSLSEPLKSSDIMISLSNATGNLITIIPGKKEAIDGVYKYNTQNLFGLHVLETTNVSGFHTSATVNESELTDSQKSTYNAGNASNFNQWFGTYTIIPGTQLTASDKAFKALSYDVISMSKSEITGDYGLDLDTFKRIFTALTEDGPSTPSGYGENDYLKIKTGNKIGDHLVDYVNTLASAGGVTNFLSDTNTTTKAIDFWYKPSDDLICSFGSTSTIMISKLLTPGDAVTVTITHIPSSSVMFSKEVRVKEAQ